jgi:molybdopterin converting factor small subunit
MSSVLIDGRTAHQEDLEQQLTEAVRIEVLPPFAGGA